MEPTARKKKETQKPSGIETWEQRTLNDRLTCERCVPVGVPKLVQNPPGLRGTTVGQPLSPFLPLAQDFSPLFSYRQ